MSLLNRYLLRNNLFLLLSILLLGTGLYLLTDIFDRLDNFLDSGIGVSRVLWYYLVKIPIIISQILPAVFLIAVIVQFGLMDKARELTALQAGGISPVAFLRFVLLYGLIWTAVQFGFSQMLGVQGDLISKRIWHEEVQGRKQARVVLHGLWFTEEVYVIHLTTAYPEQNSGEGFLSYQLDPGGRVLESTVSAQKFTITDQGWLLQDVVVMTPGDFGYAAHNEYVMDIKQDLSPFLALEPSSSPSLLPLWALGVAIDRLVASGSNVEALRTVFHAKIAFAFSIIALGMLGLTIVLWVRNLYVAVGVGLLAIFIFFAATILCQTMGEKGILPPIIAAWGVHVVLCFIAVFGLIAKIKSSFKH